ncbi:hypothetical protein chiPu_0021345, partial [Chiloscyllium punctatum]|nr:hypothetical protein [Chiloscyllium punctatum]
SLWTEETYLAMESNPLEEHRPGLLPWFIAATQILGLAAVVMTGVWMGHYEGGFAWDGGSLQFNVHPLCMVVGMIFLYGDSILVYRVFKHENKITVKILHTAIHLTGLIATIVAAGVMANVLGLVLVGFGLTVGYVVTRSEWKRAASPEEEALSMHFKTLTERDSPDSPQGS